MSNQLLRVPQHSIYQRQGCLRLHTEAQRRPVARDAAYRSAHEEAWQQSVAVENRLTFCEDPADFRSLLGKVRFDLATLPQR